MELSTVAVMSDHHDADDTTLVLRDEEHFGLHSELALAV